jgi:hypothetical protein
VSCFVFGEKVYQLLNIYVNFYICRFFRPSDGGKVWDVNALVRGDTLISCKHVEGGKAPLMFRFSFHTAFINQERLFLPKEELDGMKKYDLTLFIFVISQN